MVTILLIGFLSSCIESEAQRREISERQNVVANSYNMSEVDNSPEKLSGPEK